MSNSAQDLRGLALESQRHRLLQLTFHDEAPYRLLLPNGIEGTESLSRDFQFRIEILSDNALLEPKDFIGKRVTVRLLRNDGSHRYFNGYIFTFRHVKTDGGCAFYEAVIGPWLHYLKFGQHNRLFLDQNLHDQTATVFQDYGVLSDWTWQVREDDPPLTMACQFDEDDHNYVHRRWEHAGLVYWYEHTADSHKLIVSDPTRAAPEIDGRTRDIRFHNGMGPEEADSIVSWSAHQQTTPNHTEFSRFDFKTPTPTHVQTSLSEPDAALPVLEWNEYAGAYGYRNMEHGYQVANRRMEEIGATIKRFDAKGNNRFVMPGRWFRLTDHYGSALSRNQQDDEYLIVSVRHVATNNYLAGTSVPAEYRNEFTCVRKATPWRPGRRFNSVDTRILAPQTATVVGQSGTSIHTDEHGRVLIQFHWDREGKFTTWVRVASGWAGGSQGIAALPRIGSEVIVQWLDGNPDHPIITGRVMNARNQPSWKLPEQSALMGIRSRELGGADGNASAGRSNHLIFDDTANAIQAQLRSDHASSQLSLGKITRIEDWQGRQDARGEGFELRTDEVGAIRSGKGMVISTEVRPMAKGHLSDVGEPAARLMKAQTLHGQLGKLAQHHQAQENGADQSRIADALQSQVDGIQGAGASGNGGDGSFPELDEAQLLLAGAAGIAVTTPGTAHVTGGQHVAVTAGDTLSVATGKSFLASISDTFSLFVHKMGMKLIAASGKVQIHAQNDELELLAKKVLSIISTTDWINITAKQGIRLTAGNSRLEVSAQGIVGYTPGENRIHAGSHDTVGPQSVPAQFPGADLCSSLTNGAAQAGSAAVALS
ncbi:type VI secretion system Vgr family protein [Burkholderia sp. S-53]|uniref:type VI secretion system Vgr family protein n=1 Tax=Burkholderia sp. S-53 TaxID=2906514 RepID=UPI0021D3EB38|nr:type VI secretion system Vgr family protein [Burkholderia sp. S-53]UXU85862.1 type VI secretion system tip protein VgrG [Burkholderia sp. S-53]